MKKFIGLLILTLCFQGQALESPFPSEVDGLDIKNSHYVENLLIRGMLPRFPKDAQQLYSLDVDHVLIFKESRFKDERKYQDIKEEKQLLHSAGFTSNQITHIDFPWKGLNTPAKRQLACENVVRAIDLLEKKVAEGKRLYYHCTVGEDRTGLLSGVYRIKNHGWSPREAFYLEMCENGFGHGNHQKPYVNVVLPIRESLTPLFWKLAYVLTEKPGSWGMDMCKNLGRHWKYRQNWKPELQFLLCPSSSKFPYPVEG